MSSDESDEAALVARESRSLCWSARSRRLSESERRARERLAAAEARSSEVIAGRARSAQELAECAARLERRHDEVFRAPNSKPNAAQAERRQADASLRDADGPGLAHPRPGRDPGPGVRGAFRGRGSIDRGRPRRGAWGRSSTSSRSTPARKRRSSPRRARRPAPWSWTVRDRREPRSTALRREGGAGLILPVGEGDIEAPSTPRWNDSVARSRFGPAETPRRTSPECSTPSSRGRSSPVTGSRASRWPWPTPISRS